MDNFNHEKPSYYSKTLERHKTFSVKVGSVTIGSKHPIIVQSMTNTDTADIEATANQIIALHKAGSSIVRITVDRAEAAAAVPHIVQIIREKSIDVPIVGDFHYNGHILLSQYPDCARMLDKYRINPGNVGFGQKKDTQFASIIELAVKYEKPIRIGANWGSIDQQLLTQLMNENEQKGSPLSAKELVHETLVQSALLSANFAERIGLGSDKIIISTKVSQVQDLISVYNMLAQRCNYALHLGLTEAGMGTKGIVSSSASMSILLQQGIGDTIRISLTPAPGGDRKQEVIVAQELLQVMGFRKFNPIVSACPGCGRTTSRIFQKLAEEIQQEINENMPQWRKQYLGIENLTIAVMGCIVNGPGESKYADIGISLPGTGESPAAPVFIEGKKTVTLRGDNIANDFKNILRDYINRRFGSSVKNGGF